MSEKLKNLKNRLFDIKSQVDKKVGARDIILKDIKKYEVNVLNLEEEKKDFDKILKVLQYLYDVKKDNIRDKFEKLITKGLSSVYGKSYKYELEYAIKRDSVYASPFIVQNVEGKELRTLIPDARGGGIADIVSFLNRVIILILYKPTLRRFMALDEPFKWVSQEYIYNVNELLRTLNELLKIEFIIITHKKELVDCADKVFHTEIDSKGVTSIKVLTHDKII